MIVANLITDEVATQALAAGGITLSAAALAFLPSAVAAASDILRRWCGRDFDRRTYDEVYQLDQDGTVMLRQVPVQAVSRVSSHPAPALVVSNTDPAANQRATVRLAREAHDAPTTGLILERVASGVATTNIVAYEGHATLAALAAAVNLLGGGWHAAAESGFAPWSPAELVADGTAARNALAGASLAVWSEEVDSEIDARTGLLTLRGHHGDRVRVVYEAGFDPVPLAVQVACAEVVADLTRTIGLDSRLQSERIGDYSYTLAGAADGYAIPATVLGKLAPYRLHPA